MVRAIVPRWVPDQHVLVTIVLRVEHEPVGEEPLSNLTDRVQELAQRVVDTGSASMRNGSISTTCLGFSSVWAFHKPQSPILSH